MNNDTHPRNRRMVQQRRDTVPQHCNPAERKVLLRQWRAEAGTAAGRDKESDARFHRRRLASAARIAKQMSVLEFLLHCNKNRIGWR
jgi:hypothetical protein